MAPQVPEFHVLDDPKPDDVTLPAFMVSKTRGFLPRQDPLTTLPPEFNQLESLLQSMPICTASGAPGLLARNALGPAVEQLPDLTEQVLRYRENQHVLSALYRDYSFLASAYLLEPCHHRQLATRGSEYGVARERLPANVARPIAEVAALTGFMPFMEYAGSYALANYRLLEEGRGVEFGNLGLVRAFEAGLERGSSEEGFVLVHVDMVRHSGGLVAGAVKALEGAGGAGRELFLEGLGEMGAALAKVNEAMERMWNRSKPSEYTAFRTFIFGITSQSMFPNGVVYEGVSEEPLSFRGESGANDSMIPLCDNLLQVQMPDTPLTKILEDFRRYRPGNHREFLEYVHFKAQEVGVRRYAMMEGESARRYLRVLDGVREFRHRHWCFTREYILRQTKYQRATGGSPIVRWLPNQLAAVLEMETEVITRVRELGGRGEELEEMEGRVHRQKEGLEKEVKRFLEERGSED